jgi:hypothetical protein
MHHIDKVAFLVETNPYLLLHLQKSNSYFSWAVETTTSVSFFVAGNYKAKQQYRRY